MPDEIDDPLLIGVLVALSVVLEDEEDELDELEVEVPDDDPDPASTDRPASGGAT